jgi:hypothetical protein
MRLDQKGPVYRKVFVPWWDSEVACLLVIVFMFVAFLFGIVGISVANKMPQFRPFVWVPVLIVVLSSVVILSTTIRWIRRYLNVRKNHR